jgi:flagellar biosynthetic protein FliR
MQWLQHLDVGAFLLFTLVLSRVSGLLMTAPIYGTADIPTHVRALFTLAIAVLVFPSQWGVPVPDPGNLAQYLVLIGSELAVGAGLGLGIVILFSGIDLAGHLIDQVSGLMIAEVFDPTQGNNTSIVARLMSLVTLAVFVAIGGHRIVMAGLLDTFHTIPPGSAAIPAALGQTLVTLVGESFALGIRAAAPVVASMLLANLVLGLISRALPQLNILVIGFGINALLALGVLAISIGAAVWVFEDQIEPTVAAVLEGLKHAGYTLAGT